MITRAACMIMRRRFV